MPLKNFKKTKKNNKKTAFGRVQIHPETKKGILSILLLAVGAISLLAIFDWAGQFGQLINGFLSTVLGQLSWIFPLALILLGYFLLRPRKYTVMGLSYVALLIFVLSASGFWHLMLASDKNDLFLLFDREQGGGYLGLALSYPFLFFMGRPAGLIALAALSLMSIFVLFNTSFWHWTQTARNIKYKLGGFWWKLTHLFSKQPKEDEQGKQASESSETASAPSAESGTSFTAKDIKNDPSQKSSKNNGDFQQEVAKQNRFLKNKIDLPLNLLDNTITKPTTGDIYGSREKIKKALSNFGIEVEMGDVCIGPTVTQYTLKPAEGIKLSRITALSNDMALTLAAHPIRIEAPIPGKSLIGIEVPNQAVAIVNLKELLESAAFKKRKTNLTIPLGKDVSGQSWLTNLASLPHLLIAGATGSGKSVCIHTIITGLLYQNGPEHLRFILVDPKRVELPLYNGIPHLLVPVITDVKKTVNALRWAITEMDRRYDVLSQSGKRDIQSYNASYTEKIPYIVIVIDELADLMISATSEVEGAIIRLAQMARATGIHLVLATQRPSVDIITGLIKANFPGRIAFSVASLMDSRTILDCGGAEKLLGRGDMLYINAELSKPKRLQGAYISDIEVKRIVRFLKDQIEEPPEYNEEITEKTAVPGGFLNDISDNGDDELLEEAKNVILQSGRASATLLQRRLKVGYARAARLMDLLEEEGVIGPGEGAKPRDIFIGG
ncbi:MAG: DNA translocase FtsK 4TM domain-containing protein [Candidatus Doudnabacteria bacterium]|nr:DNA translocase FtsK 4TM domain-containing protein [Candidatus Doudnabacteria bacterium]